MSVRRRRGGKTFIGTPELKTTVCSAWNARSTGTLKPIIAARYFAAA